MKMFAAQSKLMLFFATLPLCLYLLFWFTDLKKGSWLYLKNCPSNLASQKRNAAIGNFPSRPRRPRVARVINATALAATKIHVKT